MIITLRIASEKKWGEDEICCLYIFITYNAAQMFKNITTGYFVPEPEKGFAVLECILTHGPRVRRRSENERQIQRGQNRVRELS